MSTGFISPTGEAPRPTPDVYSSIPTRDVRVTAKRPEPQRSKEDDDRDLLRVAIERFRKSAEYEQPWRKSAKEELDFLALEHWTMQQKEERKGRPCLVFDRIGPSVDQVVNNARQNLPEARFSPVGGKADKFTADAIQGLSRNISNDSGGPVVVITAYEFAVKIGRGWVRITFEYEDPDDSNPETMFQQKIVLKRVPNPFSIYPDPAATEFDMKDMRYCFVTEDVDLDEYKSQYGESKAASMATFESLGDKIRNDWFPNGAVRIAEYWWVESKFEEMAQLADRSIVPVSQLQPDQQPVNIRRVERRRVYMAKMNGVEILGPIVEWPGKRIPLIPAIGREVIKDGRRWLRGMVRSAMDANLSYDYKRSKEAEAFSLAPLSTWLVAKGQLEGVEFKWADANRKAYAFLEYNPQDVNGQMVPPPIRVNSGVDVGSLAAGIAHDDNDIKATLNTYDASLGNAGPETSGKAINARIRQGDNAHFHYYDNLCRFMVSIGEQEIDLAPHVYSEERMITILDPENISKQVPINAPFQEKDGTTRHYDFANIGKAARYDVTIGTAPSYASLKAQQTDTVMEITRAVPEAAIRSLDLIAKLLNLPDEFVARWRPPDVQQSMGNGEGPALSPEVQRRLAQDSKMIEALTQQLNQVTEVVRTKKLDLDSRERIAELQNSVALAVAEMKTKSNQGIELLKQDMGAIRHMLELQVRKDQMEMQAQQPGSTAQNAPAEQPESQEPESAEPGSAEGVDIPDMQQLGEQPG